MRAKGTVPFALTCCLALLMPAEGRGQVRPSSPGPTTPAPATAVTTDRAAELGLQEYRIGPQDVLDILVWKTPDLTRSVVVRPDGRISLPLLNDVTAAGLTPMELRQVLSSGYSEYVNAAEVSVIVREIHSVRVSVVGMVRNAGQYELGREGTVLEALALAGGLSDFAKRDQIVVLRHDGRAWRRFTFDYSTATVDPTQNFALRARDIVVVP